MTRTTRMNRQKLFCFMGWRGEMRGAWSVERRARFYMRKVKSGTRQGRHRENGLRAHNPESGVALLAAALGDLGDSGLDDFKLGIGRADGNGFIADIDDRAEDAAGGEDFVTATNAFEHFGLFFGFFLLRPDKREIK